MSCKAVCTTDGWVHLTSFFSGLARSPCLIIIPVCEWVRVWMRDMQQVNVSKFVWCLGVCMGTWKPDRAQCVHAWRRCWRCTAWNCWNLIRRKTVRLRWYAFPCYMQIGSHWISLAACWEGLRTKSICLPLLFQSTRFPRNTVSPWAQQCCRYAFFFFFFFFLLDHFFSRYICGVFWLFSSVISFIFLFN